MTDTTVSAGRDRRRLRPRPAGRGALAACLVAGALVLSACGGDGSQAAPAGPSTVTKASDGVAKAKAAVDAARGEVTAFPAPGPAFDASSLRGKTIFYVPISLKSESFQIVSKSLTEAFTALGVKVQSCDGGANPSTAAACFNQAKGSQAAGVIADAIPYGLAANAFDALKAAGIPVLIVNQLRPAGQTDSKQFAYMEGNAIQMLNLAANWIIADSGGQAKVLAQEFTDSPNTVSYLEDNAFKTLAANCSDCPVTVNKVSSANYSLIPPSTSSALLKNPDINYLVTEFDTILQPTMQGVQQAGATTKVKGVSTDGLLGGLKLLQSKDYLYADVATDYNYQAWANADMLMRMILGLDLPQATTIPLRLIDRTNIGDIKNVTADAEASGEWFGPTTYKSTFSRLWGAAA